MADATDERQVLDVAGRRSRTSCRYVTLDEIVLRIVVEQLQRFVVVRAEVVDEVIDEFAVDFGLRVQERMHLGSRQDIIAVHESRVLTRKGEVLRPAVVRCSRAILRVETVEEVAAADRRFVQSKTAG